MFAVIPAKAGIQVRGGMNFAPGLRRGDRRIRHSRASGNPFSNHNGFRLTPVAWACPE